MKNNVELLLHNIRSVYNVAGIFRTAECLGVDKIWLSGYTPAPIDRFGRARSDFHKVSLGTEQDIDWEVIDDLDEFIKTKKSDQYQVIALEQDLESVALRHFRIATKKILLIPGTETTGVESDLLGQCDQIIEIEQRGDKESLNVQSATAIALWHLLQ